MSLGKPRKKMELRFGAHLWGLEGVVRRKVNVEEENAAGVGRA